MLLIDVATIRRRTSSWPNSVQPHMGWVAEGLKASPNFTLSNCSTRPVHDPHEAEALVWERTSSTFLRPSLSIAPVIFPLHMPLQPQISASSGKAATAAVGSRGVLPPWYD